jgi:hypothetical protein
MAFLLDGLPCALCVKGFLPPVPIQVSPIPIHIPVFAPQFSALVPRGPVVFPIQIAAQLPPVMRDPGLIMPDVPPFAPSIVGKHRSHTQPHQQQHSRNRPFHTVVLLRIQRILPNSNPLTGPELR